MIDVRDVVKTYGGMRPLRLKEFVVQASDTIVLSGLDAGAAETFVHLISGASLPDEGRIHVEGTDMREIATDTDWLASLDRFGIVTHRAVFIEGLTVAANLALPLTLAVDPMSAETRADVERLAALSGIGHDRLDVVIGTLTPAERLRVHLSRAFATRPRMLLLEHPTATLESTSDREAFGALLKRAAAAAGIGFVALSEDPMFGAASGATRLRLDASTGATTRPGAWWPWTRR